MAKQFEIQLKFTTGGSAQALMQKLDNLAKAQNKLAKVQRTLNTQSKAAIRTHVQLIQSQEKHRLAVFKSQKQIGKLNQQIAKLRLENKMLAARLKKTSAGLGRMRLATAGLTRMVGVLRNQILLFTFAFGTFIAGFKSSIDISMQFEAVKVRLNSMFGSVERGEQAFRKFNQIAATTPFTLTDVVEAGAALKAFGTNAEEMIKPTSDLAAFMGVTATEAAQALGRAFAGGAGAADILRERGILQLIRDTKGIEDLSKLTLPEFRQALQDTLIDPSVGIAGATDRLSKTMTGLVSNMADAFTRMKAAIGDFFDFKGVVETLTGAFETLGERVQQANETAFETSIRHLQQMNIDTTKLELTQAKLIKTRMEENNVMKDVGVAETELQRRMDIRIAATQGLAALQENLIKNGTSEEAIRKRIAEIDKDIISAGRGQDKEQIKSLQNERKSLINTQDALDRGRIAVAFTEKQVELGLITLEQATEYQAAVAKVAGLEEKIANSKKTQTEEGKKIIKLAEDQLKIMADADKLRLETREQLFSEHFNKVLSVAQRSIEQQKQAEISALRDTDKFRRASAEERQDMEKDALKNLQNQQNTIFKINQANEIIKVILSSMSTASKLKDMADELKGVATAAFAVNNVAAGKKALAGAAALRVQRGLVIASGAAQAGLLAGQQPPQFARGGSFITDGQQSITVGDNPGGRERVDITPLSTPDFGDAGGGSSINVNIMGNVIGTQEFVRDNLLPEIENTIKRNLA